MAPSLLRGRMRTVTYLYDDLQHPERPSGHVESPSWTDDDRALMLALREYEDTLCPGCGVEKALAWHEEAEGFFEGHGIVCHACTALQGQQAVYRRTELDPVVTPERRSRWAPFDVTKTVTEPTQRPDDTSF